MTDTQWYVGSTRSDGTLERAQASGEPAAEMVGSKKNKAFSVVSLRNEAGEDSVCELHLLVRQQKELHTWVCAETPETHGGTGKDSPGGEGETSRSPRKLTCWHACPLWSPPSPWQDPSALRRQHFWDSIGLNCAPMNSQVEVPRPAPQSVAVLETGPELS